MSLFESINNSSDSAADIGKKYVTNSLSYIKLKTFFITALSISTVTKIVLVGGIITIGILFLSIALAITLGDYFESLSLGCLSVGLLYLFIGLIVYLLRSIIDKKVIKSLSAKFFNSKS